MFMEALPGWLPPRMYWPPAWAFFQDAAGSPSLRETGYQFVSIVGVIILAVIWLRLAFTYDTRVASLAVTGIVGLATGAAYAVGKENSLELAKTWRVQVLLFFTLFIALTQGRNEVFRTLASFFMTGITSMVVGQTVALYLSNAGPAGEMIVELLITLFS